MIVRIKASRPVYRRLGVVFGRQYQEYAEDHFTAEELERLQADPVLTVTVADGELAAADGQPGGDGLSGGDTPETQPAPASANPDKAPAKAAPKPRRAANPKTKTPAKVKASAKAATKPADKADKDQQPTGDGANSSAKAAEGDGSGAGQE